MQDFIPVLGFFIGYYGAKYFGHADNAIFIATGILMGLSVLQILYRLIRNKPVEKKHWLITLVILVLGGITLVIHNDLFIKMKPTVINIIIAVVFLGSEFLGKENLTKKMLKSVFEMPNIMWKKLNMAWVVFFLFEGLLNLFIALKFDNDIYVNFKFWGLLALTLIFFIGQMFFLRKYIKAEHKEEKQQESKDE